MCLFMTSCSPLAGLEPAHLQNTFIRKCDLLFVSLALANWATREWAVNVPHGLSWLLFLGAFSAYRAFGILVTEPMGCQYLLTHPLLEQARIRTLHIPRFNCFLMLFCPVNFYHSCPILHKMKVDGSVENFRGIWKIRHGINSIWHSSHLLLSIALQ